MVFVVVGEPDHRNYRRKQQADPAASPHPQPRFELSDFELSAPTRRGLGTAHVGTPARGSNHPWTTHQTTITAMKTRMSIVVSLEPSMTHGV